MSILLAALVTAAAVSMSLAAAAMIYDTTRSHPGIGDRAARVVAILWLWPVVVAGLFGLGYGLSALWTWALLH
jgi:hypothetical protein